VPEAGVLNAFIKFCGGYSAEHKVLKNCKRQIVVLFFLKYCINNLQISNVSRKNFR